MPIQPIEEHGGGKDIPCSARREPPCPAPFIQPPQAATTLGAAHSPGIEDARGAATNEFESRLATAIEHAGVIENCHHGEQRIQPRHPLVDAVSLNDPQRRQRNLKDDWKAGRCLPRGPDAGMALTNTIAV